MTLRSSTILSPYQPAFQQRLLLASSGDGGEASPGGAGNAGNGAAAIDWGAFTKSLDDLPARINKGVADALGPKLDGLTHVVRDASKPPAPEPEPPPNFDEMTNGQVVEWLHGHTNDLIANAIKEALVPFTEKLVSLETNTSAQEGKREVDRLKGQHKDLTDWKDEMLAIAGTQYGQHMPIEDIYLLAKVHNPEKARTLELKYNPPVEKPKPFAFSNGFSSNDGDKPTILDKSTAAREAGREVEARHSGVLRALRDL
jgi:hypothetical protein